MRVCSLLVPLSPQYRVLNRGIVQDSARRGNPLAKEGNEGKRNGGPEQSSGPPNVEGCEARMAS